MICISDPLRKEAKEAIQALHACGISKVVMMTGDSRRTAEAVAREVGVGAVPGSSFFREPVNHLIRFHFAKKDETLLNALNRLESLRAKIPSRKRN